MTPINIPPLNIVLSILTIGASYFGLEIVSGQKVNPFYIFIPVLGIIISGIIVFSYIGGPRTINYHKLSIISALSLNLICLVLFFKYSDGSMPASKVVIAQVVITGFDIAHLIFAVLNLLGF